MDRENLRFLHELTLLVFGIVAIYLSATGTPLTVVLGTCFVMLATQIFLSRFQENGRQDDEPSHESDEVLARPGLRTRMADPYIMATFLLALVNVSIAARGADPPTVSAGVLYTAVILFFMFYFERCPPSPPSSPQNVEQRFSELRTESRLRLLSPTSRGATSEKERRRSWHGNESVRSQEDCGRWHRRASV